jgi:hypothetical protein
MKEQLMGLVRPVLLIALVVPVLVACNEDNTLGLADSDRPVFTATLSGANVRPIPVATTANATAQMSIRDPEVGQVGRQLTYTIVGTNLTSATSAHIHLGGAAIGLGPVLVTLYTNPSDTALTSATLVTGSIPESAFSGFSLDSLVKLMSIGAAYVDIHATGNPLGLVRGQLSKKGEEPPLDLFAAPSLTGAKERPTPVVTTATGSATFELRSDATIRFQVKVAGLTGATMAHIHTAVADSAGPIAVTLFTSSVPTGLLTDTLATGTFSQSNIQLSGVSFDSLLVLMWSGRTYVNVHTNRNPDGEIRAQIEPVTALPK